MWKKNFNGNKWMRFLDEWYSIYITAIALDEFAHSCASSECVDNKTFSHFIYTIIESIPLAPVFNTTHMQNTTRIWISAQLFYFISENLFSNIHCSFSYILKSTLVLFLFPFWSHAQTFQQFTKANSKGI